MNLIHFLDPQTAALLAGQAVEPAATGGDPVGTIGLFSSPALILLYLIWQQVQKKRNGNGTAQVAPTAIPVTDHVELVGLLTKQNEILGTISNTQLIQTEILREVRSFQVRLSETGIFKDHT